MRKVFGFILLVLIASVIIYYLLFNHGANYIIKNDIVVHNIGMESQYKILSMRQIDSLTADFNYSFTIKNAVTHLNRESLRTPLKPEKSSI
jgi:hypothetical protein